LLGCFQLFDSKGQLKNIQKTKDDFDTALQLIQTLNHIQINEQIKSIEACKSDLFYFAEIAKKTVSELAQSVNREELEMFCTAFQAKKNSIKIKGNSIKKASLKRKEGHILAFLEEVLGSDYQLIKERIYGKLEQIIQSSAAVECINSILRPYLNTQKNQVNQAFLNLFMFYHNHRRFKAGKRKAKSPAELFTGKTQKADWLDLLLEKVAS
jgi:translation initiation factor 2 alpha subunit (eIF-2alpha)